MYVGLNVFAVLKFEAIDDVVSRFNGRRFVKCERKFCDLLLSFFFPEESL